MTQSASLQPQTFVYKTVGKLPIHADVYRRPGDDIRALVFWIHGGALIMGSRFPGVPAAFTRYLDAGFVVVSIDYRLAPETKLPAIIEDLTDAFAWVRREGPMLFRIDPDRIAAVGHSAGGYLALMAGVRCQPRAVVSFYGYGDIIGGWYSRPDPFYCTRPAVTDAEAKSGIGSEPVASVTGYRPFYLHCRQHGTWPREVAGFDPADVDTFHPYCPLQNITPDYPPTLLLHGDIDTDVPYAQSVLLAYEMLRHGVKHKLHTALGGPHGFDVSSTYDPAAVAAANSHVLEFLKRHVG